MIRLGGNVALNLLYIIELIVAWPLPAVAETPVGAVTVSVGYGMNVAVTLFDAVMVKLHVLCVPVHDPLHPLNIELADGAAVRVTTSFFQ